MKCTACGSSSLVEGAVLGGDLSAFGFYASDLPSLKRIFGMGSSARNQDLGGGRCDGRHAVMLGIPEPCVAKRVAQLRQLNGFGQGVRRRGAFGNGGEIEDREGKGLGHGVAIGLSKAQWRASIV